MTTDLTTTIRSDFFGKDRLVFFLGSVEDVNDPKHSGRVKVRCVGWHPNEKDGENGLSTEDLPWAHVCLPTTHPQQGRLGGKHGLLVGCWVIGFFFDGDEAQQPIILNSFPFTARAVDEPLRENLDGEDGTAAETDKPFAKVMPSPKTHPNISTVTPKEQNTNTTSDPVDPDGDTQLEESDDPCFGVAALRSVSHERLHHQEKKVHDQGNPESQIYDIILGDGLCGTIAHAKDDIKRKLKERMPSQFARFVFNDAVWNRFTGEYINLNGILLQLAFEICNILKQPAEASKAKKEEEVNRRTKSESITKVPDRDFVEDSVRMVIDDTTSFIADKLHAIFGTAFIDVLCDIIMALLQQTNNSGSSSSGNNVGGDLGSSRNTLVEDWESDCITDNLLSSVSYLTDLAFDLSLERAEREAERGGGGSDLLGGVASILSTLVGGMFFPLSHKYTLFTDLFNRVGTDSQDIVTKLIGCSPERLYNTAIGGLPSGGFGGGGSGGRGENGDYSDLFGPNLSFGGLSTEIISNSITTETCEESREQKVPQNGVGNDSDQKSEGGFYTEKESSDVEVPDGSGGEYIAVSLPSENESCARNFVNGLPNSVIVNRPGQNYFFRNSREPKNAYPHIYIRGYKGTPVPVVDPVSGELVSLVTDCRGFAGNPNISNPFPNSQFPGNDRNTNTSTGPFPSIVVAPGDSSIGISTDDEDYDITVGGIFIPNTGQNYESPIIIVTDRDNPSDSGESNTDDDSPINTEVTVVEGRIVDVKVNSSKRFRRTPAIRVRDRTGYGARLLPIMSVVPREESNIPILPPQDVVYCPPKLQKNFYSL